MDDYLEEEENFNVANIPPSYALKMNGFLREACKQGHVTCIDVLVGKGADVNYMDKEDKTTVLHIAMMNGKTNVVEYLLDKASEKTLKAAHSYVLEKQEHIQQVLQALSRKGIRLESHGSAEQTSKPTGDTTNGTMNGTMNGTANGTVNGTDITSTATLASSPTTSMPTPTSAPRKTEGDGSSEKSAEPVTAKISSIDYENQIHLLTKTKDEIQSNFDTFKKQTAEIIEGLHSQVEKLTEQLKSEREINQETRDLLTHLGRELSLSKDQEIAPVKGEKDVEKRAKEIAKMILSVGDINLPPVKVHRNPLLDIEDGGKHKIHNTNKSKSTIDLSNFNIQGKGNTPPTAGFSSSSGRSKKHAESRDDIEIHSSDGIKYRVKRLVKRWEGMTEIQPAPSTDPATAEATTLTTTTTTTAATIPPTAADAPSAADALPAAAT